MNSLKTLFYRGRDFFFRQLRDGLMPHPDAATQIQLKLFYQNLARSGGPLPGLSEVGFKAFSQTDEDGILLYLFAIIGMTDRRAVELCAGNGIECNTANLIINHGWHGLLLDGNEAGVKRGQDFYRTHPSTYVYPPKFVHAWITRDNVNDLLRNNGFEGEIDLLSLDMDGVDYWMWDAIQAIQPRVVLVEYQDILGPEKCLTVPYSDSFCAHEYPVTQGMPNYCGASLGAFTKLAKSRGYRLVGCNRYGYNAFFVKNPLGLTEIPEVSVQSCFTHSKVLWGMRERFPTVASHPWVEV